MKWLDSENQKYSQTRDKIMTCDLDWLFELASEVCNLDVEEEARCIHQAPSTISIRAAQPQEIEAPLEKELGESEEIMG